MGGPNTEATIRRACLSRTLKALRRRRGVRATELAQALGMPLRSYQHFESGRCRINVDRIHEVARILDADPHAILAAADVGSPEFAVRTADNKLMTILVMSLKDFDEAAGDQIAQLDVRVLMDTFKEVFQDLAKVANDRREAIQRALGPRRPGPAR
jgi:transcriptional regulator with XRE-family HTH domain